MSMYQKMLIGLSLIIGLYAFSGKVVAQDPDFHIYLCFGQSNMEGQGNIEAQDRTVDGRFMVMEAINCNNLNRSMGSWYSAVPPLTRCYTKLSPADYFGRTMVENLPENIRVGIINVSVAGCKIELFDKETSESYSANVESWMKNIISEYDGNPYQRLVDMARLAQSDGVIKGILLHQGESNTGDQQWPAKVKKIYNDLMTDLSLNPDSVPILAGEVVHADQGGVCASMNSIIAKLPQSIPNAHVISSSACTDTSDNLHFNSAGYRELGRRYGAKMLSIMGIEISDPEEPEEPQGPEGTETFYYEPECANPGENWDIVADETVSGGKYVTVKAGIQSLSEAAGSEGAIVIPFSVNTDSTYHVYGLMNCPTADDDSYWVQVDNSGYTMANGLATSGWQWMQLNSYVLTAGEHTLTITYREEGAKLDKIALSNYSSAPQDQGEKAYNSCDDDSSSLGFEQSGNKDFLLLPNFPNPFSMETNIAFQLTSDAYVSLKVYNIMGIEIAELAGKKFVKGLHQVRFEAGNLPAGSYFCTLITGQHIQTRKLILVR
ncbi:MAG: T9SS type A sorting domain-containing protein [Prolixibacteraceae bacterium]|nr:T9SS type A sorting domain-containing protein [Prolixibacteraceae bacterium]